MSLFEEASLVITPNGFKAGKLYAVKGADLSVLRATSATRVNANGVIETVGANVPLIDHTGGGCPTILVQPQRTNLVAYTEKFDNSYWVKQNITVTANSTTSPDGTNSADTFIANDVLTQHRFDRAISGTGGTTYTFSAFFKAKEYDKIALRTGNGGIGYFNLTLGTVTSADSGVTANIVNFGNGWYRCSVSQILTTTSAMTSRINILDENGLLTFAGNNTKGLYLWGAQLEAGSNATSYIKTEATTVTRNADVITLTPTTGLTEIKETFENGTTNVITTIPSTYTMSQGRIKNVVMK
jgi:hypothetical protein